MWLDAVRVCPENLVCRILVGWYDLSMTKAKIAITLPEEQLARVKQAVQRGDAGSVSAYIVQALSEKEQVESLSALVDQLIAEHGEPSRRAKAWARKAISRKPKA